MAPSAWKAILLSSVDTVENNSEPTPADTAHTHEAHDHEHEHAHEPGHEHASRPVLNPDRTRELVLDIPAEDVAKSFPNITRNYHKYAQIPGFPAGQLSDTAVKL